MPTDPRAAVFALENVIYDHIETEVSGVLDGKYEITLDGKPLSLTWSESMSMTSDPGDDLLVVDQDGNEYVLDIEVALRRRVVQQSGYSPEREGE